MYGSFSELKKSAEPLDFADYYFGFAGGFVFLVLIPLALIDIFNRLLAPNDVKYNLCGADYSSFKLFPIYLLQKQKTFGMKCFNVPANDSLLKNLFILAAIPGALIAFFSPLVFVYGDPNMSSMLILVSIPYYVILICLALPSFCSKLTSSMTYELTRIVAALYVLLFVIVVVGVLYLIFVNQEIARTRHVREMLILLFGLMTVYSYITLFSIIIHVLHYRKL